MKTFQIMRIDHTRILTSDSPHPKIPVAEGIIFKSGKVVINWLGDVASVVVHDNIENVIKIHCNGDASLINDNDGSVVSIANNVDSVVSIANSVHHPQLLHYIDGVYNKVDGCEYVVKNLNVGRFGEAIGSSALKNPCNCGYVIKNALST